MSRFILCLAVLGLLAAHPALAADGDPKPLNLTEEGVAMKGYDVVAYHLDARPIPGNRSIAVEHGGATYQFASEENRQTFLSDPDRFAPAYGGYCAFGVLMGEKVDSDPAQFRFVDGRLLVFFSGGTHSQWAKNPSANLSIGDQVWTRIRDVPQSRLPLAD